MSKKEVVEQESLFLHKPFSCGRKVITSEPRPLEGQALEQYLVGGGEDAVVVT